MNRGDIVHMLELEARRRPVVADLLARAETLTDNEIDEAPLPLKWYKDALKEARNRIVGPKQQAKVAAELAKIAALQSTPEEHTSVNLKTGLTLQYTGDNFWAKARRGFLFEIRNGDLLFFPDDGEGAWLNQTFFDRPPAQLKQSRKVKEQTRKEYLDDYQKGLLSLPCSGTTVVDGISASAQGSPMGGFRYSQGLSGVSIQR